MVAHTGEIAGGLVGGLLVVLTAIALFLYRNWRYEQELDSLLWKVNYKDIQIKEEAKVDTVSSSDAIVNNNSKVI